MGVDPRATARVTARARALTILRLDDERDKEAVWVRTN